MGQTERQTDGQTDARPFHIDLAPLTTPAAQYGANVGQTL